MGGMITPKHIYVASLEHKLPKNWERLIERKENQEILADKISNSIINISPK